MTGYLNFPKGEGQAQFAFWEGEIRAKFAFWEGETQALGHVRHTPVPFSVGEFRLQPLRRTHLVAHAAWKAAP